MDDRILRGRGPISFTIHGELRHMSGSLLPEEDNNPCYSQLYIYDPNEAFEVRKKRNNNLDPRVLKIIQDTLLEENQLCQIYKNAFEILKEANHDENLDIAVRLSYMPGTDPRRYNLPTSDDVSVLLPGDGTEKAKKRDIVLHLKNHRLVRISECHPLYLPTHFVLLFPKGDLGWHTEMKHWDKVNQRFYTGDQKQNRLTLLEYFRYRLFERNTESSALFLAGPLFQEFIVDAWASYEQNRLYYVKENQSKLRCEVYGGLSDIVINGDDPREIGKRFILPSSHIGSPRHMYEIYQDSMALTRYFKHPDIFLTVTANPKWPEIQNELKSGQSATDRPDLVARVFELKRTAIVHEILHNNVFGKVVGRVYTIEFQKRGLPHMHALFFLHHDDKIRTADQVDKIVSAEFPDPEKHPELFETVKKCMVHGPCGTRNMFNSCMENDVCKFHYPKEYATETKLDTDGYPIYRRRETSKTYKVRGHMVDNRDVVPYNPYLSEMFDCHINVEICASIRAVKYIHKYIYKGHDRATMVVGGVDDEIQQYIDARYIGPTEGAWRLFGNRMHEEYPSVERLALHLEGMHLCVFNPYTPKEEILERAKNQKSSLTAFFDYCNKNPDARCYTYQEFPEHFVWNKGGKKEWTPRMTSAFSIGRLYFANPNCGERFYLRLLLTVVAGPVSFESLYWFENIKYNTYKEACIARGLLENDNEWDKCLAESALIKTGYQLRKLFILILTECNLACPGALWETHCLDICDDLPHKLRTQFLIPNPSDEEVYDYGLFLLNDYLKGVGKTLSDYPNMPLPSKDWHRTANNRLIFEHEALAYEGLNLVAEEKIAKMNPEQLHAYTEVTNSVLNNSGKMFFLNGPAGTGKTFVYNTIVDSLRSKGHIVIMVASSGVASLLLTGGRTAHSTFKIPLNVLDDSVCDIGKKSFKAELFKRAKLIVWDEVPMQHRYCVEAVDRSLQDILGNKKRFGGITVVLGGDFKQTLPVIPKGTRPQIVCSSLNDLLL